MSDSSRQFGTGSKTILIPLQFGVFAIVATYMVYFTVAQHQRNHRQWPAIISRLSPSWNKPSTSQAGNLAWRLAAFRDAGVMMEIADYAERNATEFDKGLLAEIRSAAIQARFSALSLMSRR